MTRAAIYARFSTQMQREASIEDQVRLCRERAERDGWTRRCRLRRPGAVRRLDAAAGPAGACWRRRRRGGFEVVLAEALDRLSRDQADVAALYKQLTLRRRPDRHPGRGRGQRAACRAEGHDEPAVPQGPRRQDPPRTARAGSRPASPAAAIPSATMSSAEACPTGRWRPASAGSIAHEAAIVRRIFDDYAARPFAEGDRRQPEPRGRPRPARRQLERLDDPRQSGARHRHPQQRALHRAPGLEPAALPQGPGHRPARLPRQSRRRLDHHRGPGAPHRRRRASGRRSRRARAPRRCPAARTAARRSARPTARATCSPGWSPAALCGGGMSMISATHLGCSAARNKGTCDEPPDDRPGRARAPGPRRSATRLMDPELFAVFCEEFTAETNRLRRGRRTISAVAQEQELARIGAISTGWCRRSSTARPARAVTEKIDELEARRDQLEAARPSATRRRRCCIRRWPRSTIARSPTSPRP